MPPSSIAKSLWDTTRTILIRTTRWRLPSGKKGEQDGSVEPYAAARKHFRAMLDINPDLQEAAFAKQNIAAIDSARTLLDSFQFLF